MASITRRQALKSAAALGAALAWPSLFARAAKTAWTERRDLYPQGVASGDPQPDSVLLWTRRPPGPEGAGGAARTLQVEIAEDADLGGHGYAVVRASAEDLQVELVCIPRPLERSDRPDGGPLAYRVTHRARLWTPGVAPRLERLGSEGELPLGA
jgi:hypothetical protein